MHEITKHLIKLIVAEHYGGDKLKCGLFLHGKRFPKQFQRDLLHTFNKMGYEQAKGVFLMDYQAQM